MWWARLATVATVGRRRGEAFQARGAIRRSRKAYNCCPGPGWPLWRHCWTKTGPAEKLVKPKVPSVAFGIHRTAVLGLAGHCGAIAGRRLGRLRRGEAFQARGAIRRFRKALLGRLRRGEGFQARGAIRRFRKPGHGGAIAGRRQVRLRGAIRGFRTPHNCCPGWPLGAIAG